MEAQAAVMAGHLRASFIKDRDLLYQEIAGKYWKISFASLLSPPFICIIISRMVLRCPLGVFHAPAQAQKDPERT